MQFPMVHKTTEAYYNFLFEQFDDIAERVLQLGSKPIARVEGYLERSTIKETEDTFRKQLSEARTLAYLSDNAGEIVFDSVLIEYLLHHYKLERIRLVIRETPFLNDVSSETHLPASLRNHPKIEILKLSVVPSERNPDIWETMIGSDLVLCKGMANFENYSEQPDFYSLFISKCELVSKLVAERTQTTIETGDWVFLHNS